MSVRMASQLGNRGASRTRFTSVNALSEFSHNQGHLPPFPWVYLAGATTASLPTNETLIESTRNPEYDACRALWARGIAGRLEIWRVGTTYPASAINIERGSRWTILETERESPRIARRQPFSTEHVADANSARADGARTAAKHLAAATLA